MPEDIRPMVEEGARRESRVVLRLRPYATFESPPRHVSSAGDVKPELTHGYGALLPWAATEDEQVDEAKRG